MATAVLPVSNVNMLLHCFITFDWYINCLDINFVGVGTRYIVVLSFRCYICTTFNRV